MHILSVWTYLSWLSIIWKLWPCPYYCMDVWHINVHSWSVGWLDSKAYQVHSCVCIYIYIYMCVCGCICVGLCVLKVALRIIFTIFEAASDCLEGLPFSVYLGAKTKQRVVLAWIGAKVRGRKLERQGPKTLVIQAQDPGLVSRG